VHLDGLKEHHDKAVSQKGVFDRAVIGDQGRQGRGFTVNVNGRSSTATRPRTSQIPRLHDGARRRRFNVAGAMPMSARLTRSTSQPQKDEEGVSATCFALGKGKKGISCIPACFSTSLAGNQNYECKPWGMPARNIFGSAKACYRARRRLYQDLQELNGDDGLERPTVPASTRNVPTDGALRL